jgi:hypothetical protein
MDITVCFFVLIVLFFCLMLCIVFRKGYVRAGLKLPFASLFFETTDPDHAVRPMAVVENPKIDGRVG